MAAPMNSPRRPSEAKEEKKEYKKAIAKRPALAEGQTYYVVSSAWFKQWQKYVKDEGTDPGPIDNSALILPVDTPLSITTSPSKSSEPPLAIMKPGLLEREHYEVLPESVWQLFYSWYGGGPVIQRKVIVEGRGSVPRVEVYLQRVDAYLNKKDGSPDPSTKKSFWLSKKTRLRDLVAALSKHYNIPLTSFRLWTFEADTDSSSSLTTDTNDEDEDENVKTNSSTKKDDESDSSTKKDKKQKKNKKEKENWKIADKFCLLDDMDKTLDDAMFSFEQKILVERCRSDRSFPRDKAKKKKKGFFASLFTPTRGSGNSAQLSPASTNGGATETYPRGLVGLRNLGNTCFMNSALQCLSNTGPLCDYFLEGKYKAEINKTNPLGMKGNIAEQFGNLMRMMWSGEEPVISPKNFKHVLERWAPQFEGFQQHDAQELLAFLLDGLHEDLNRITNKPYVEQQEANGRPHEIVAEEAWKGHLARNYSIITDLFHGQLKSTVTCPHCNKISITFDPFMYLSLPLVHEADRWIEVTLIRHNDTNIPVKHAVKVSKGGYIQEVRESVAQIAKVHPSQIILADMEDHRLAHVYKDSEHTSLISSDDVVLAFQLPAGKSYTHIRIFQRKRRRRGSGNGQPFSTELFGVPFIISVVSGEITGYALYQMIWERVKRFVRLPSESESSSETHGDENGESEDRDEDSSEQSHRANGHDKRMALEFFKLASSDLGSSLPFRLSLVNAHGERCGRCGTACSGCPIEPTPIPLVFDTTDPAKTIAVAVDWEPIVEAEYIDHDEAMSVKLKRTLMEARKEYKDRDSITLHECLKMFTTNERLGPNDPWYCPQCKEHRRAWKKFDIWRLPEILVIHLKRFQFTTFHRTKINYFVDYPITGLSLDDYIINPNEKGAVYDLFAVSNHMGGLGGGHYTAFAKNRLTDQWYSFNDTSVMPIKDLSSIKSSASYVLFYQRRPQTDKTSASSTEASKRSDHSTD